MKPNNQHLLQIDNGGAFPFHYGGEADQYTFYRIPKLLFSEPRLLSLSTDAKLLYGLMLDRMGLSLKNGWFDEEGRVFIYFSVEQIMKLLCCGNAKCTRLLQELDNRTGVGLISRVKQGLGKPDVIYVHKCLSGISKAHLQTFQNNISVDAKKAFQEMSNSNGNNTEINNTQLSDTDLFFSTKQERKKEMNQNSVREQYRAMIMNHIEYESIVSVSNRIRLDEIVELMVDTVCSNQEYIIIGGDKKPLSVVKSQFSKLNGGHIQFVLECMDQNTSKVRNIRKYLLSVLYNASMTIDSYYTALVNHDLYG